MGGVLLMILTVALQPATDVRDCPNYGGNGNASAFPNEMWDLFYPLLLFAWLCAVVVEQVLPVTWNGRRGVVILGRALLAVTGVLTASCCVTVQLLALCH